VLLPGITTDPEIHPGDEFAFVVEGKANFYLPGRTDWFELNPRDGFFVPQGVPHQYANTGDRPATILFCNAPKYR
jgi:quercetin dioxygenase-like cupin family protein